MMFSKGNGLRALKGLFVYFSMYFNQYIEFCFVYGGVAQLARAPALQAGGQEFDSPHLHQTR